MLLLRVQLNLSKPTNRGRGVKAELGLCFLNSDLEGGGGCPGEEEYIQGKVEEVVGGEGGGGCSVEKGGYPG